MTIVDIAPNTTYKLLKRIKKIMKEKNPLFKVNNDTTIKHDNKTRIKKSRGGQRL